MIEKASRRETFYYGETDRYLYQALDEMGSSLTGSLVGIIGCTIPWYESILLSYGAKPVVIEYQAITTDDQRVVYLTPDEAKESCPQFDLLLSISSTEHDGLGRYGDPIDPHGDLKSMKGFKNLLKPEGKFLLAVPVGPDLLVWNAHRIYGRKRLRLLLKEWEVVKSYGFDPKKLDGPYGEDAYQPLFLLTPR